MAVLNVFGAELQTLTANVEIVSTTGTVTIDTSIKRSGAASYKFVSAGTESSMQVDNDPGSAGDYVRQVAIYVPTDGLPASLTPIIQLNDSSGNHTSIRLNSNGTLELWKDPATAAQQGSDSAAITLDAWNVIELDVGVTHGGNDMVAKLNGVSFAEAATHASGADHRFMEVGIMGAVTATMYVDDIVVASHAGTANGTTWPNGIKLALMSPNADGDTAPNAGTWNSIEEIPPDDADYIEEDDDAGVSSYNMESSSNAEIPSDALIQLVAVGARIRAETATSASWQPGIKSQASGTVLLGTSTTIALATFGTNDDTTTTRVYKLVSYTDPQAGGSWTPALLDTMQLQFGAPDATPDVWCSAMWAYVGYFEKTSNIIFRDQFSVSADTALQSKTPDVGTSWSVLWQTTAGTDAMAIGATDRASPEAGTDSGVIYTADTTYPSADYAVEFEFLVLDLAATKPQYIFVRVQDQENMYAVRFDDQGGTSTCQLYKKVSGTWSTLGSAFSPPPDGAIGKLEMVGTALKFYTNGVVVASATDSDITAAGKAGLGFGGGAELVTSTDDMDVDNDLDNFTVYDLTSAITSTQTIQGLARITATTTKTILGLARITATTTKTILGLSRIQVVTTKTIQGLSRITAITTQTILGLSRITASTTQTILGKGDILKSVSQTILGIAQVTITNSQTLQGLARITATTTKTLTGLARITIVSTKTILGLARIQISTSQTIQGISRLTVSTTQTILGLAKITATTTKNILGLGDILKSTTKTITGVATLASVGSQTILGLARITATTTKTILGKSDILKATTQTITGITTIGSIGLQTIQGLARITVTAPQTILGKADILKTVSQTLLGVSRIALVTTKTLLGVSRIALVTNKTLQGLSRIAKNVTQTILGLARIAITTSQTILGKSSITVAGTTIKIILGKASLATSGTQSIVGFARIIASTQEYQFAPDLSTSSGSSSTAISSGLGDTIVESGNEDTQVSSGSVTINEKGRNS